MSASDGFGSEEGRLLLTETHSSIPTLQGQAVTWEEHGQGGGGTPGHLGPDPMSAGPVQTRVELSFPPTGPSERTNSLSALTFTLALLLGERFPLCKIPPVSKISHACTNTRVLTHTHTHTHEGMNSIPGNSPGPCLPLPAPATWLRHCGEQVWPAAVTLCPAVP